MSMPHSADWHRRPPVFRDASRRAGGEPRRAS